MERRSAATTPSMRFLGVLLKQPDGAGGGEHELELDERDVVWSSSTSATSSPSPTASPSGLRRQQYTARVGFPAGSLGLSAFLAADDDDDGDGYAPTAAIPAAARPERKQPQQPYHQSAPVAVPAWHKAATDRNRLRQDAEQEAAAADADYDYDYDDDDLVVPPHEMAARRAAAAASVMEGAGRTLKGRDLRRVRNAVWRTTGFLDL